MFFVAIAIMIIASCNEKKKFDGYLYPIRENGLYGYIDSVGNRIIEPQFLWVSTFNNGLAMAVVDTIYREVPDSLDFEVNVRDTISTDFRMLVKYGYIDKTGKFAIKPTLISYVSMPERGYVVSEWSGCRKALSRHIFQSKRALFCDTRTWKNGYIDTNGNIVIDPKYYYSEPFGDGLAVVRDAVGEPLYTNKACITSTKLRSAYIDTIGNAVTEFKYESLTRFLSGRGIGHYKVVNKETINIEDTIVEYETYTEPRYLLNKKGETIKELNFNSDYYGYTKDGISVTMDNIIWALTGEKHFSFIDVNGEFLKPLKGLTDYQIDSLRRCKDIMEVLPDNAIIRDATYFNNGFAGISPDSIHWFVIDKYLLIHGYGDKSIFEGFGGFNYGIAAVKRNGKWGYINRKIKEQIPCKYDSCGLAYPFLEEIFEYDIQGNIAKVAYINRNDSLVWENNNPITREKENKYSTKNIKDWGKWTYEYNPLNKYLLYLIIGAIVILLITICVIWKSVSFKSSKEVVLDENIIPNETENKMTIDVVQNNINDDDLDVLPIYPSISQYMDTIKQAAIAPDEYFDKLKYLQPVLDSNGDPIMSSGNFAVVFKMKDEYGKQYAVKCFHRAQKGRGKSYRLICEELAKVSSQYLLPIQYFEKELFIDSMEYPVLLMDWVDGIPLNKYICQNINDGKLLRRLARDFKELSIWLLTQPFAHGDLKPDNILVKQDGSLVLVDYDGMFVSSMKGEKTREIGSPDFRNPSRSEMDFDKNIDNFPIVSILLSLEMIAEKSDYIERYGADDRLLFSCKDYLNLKNSDVFKRAIVSYANDIPNLAAMLEGMVNGELYNSDDVKNLLLTNNLHNRLEPNKKIERKSYWFVGIYSIIVLFLPLYLRSIFTWHIVMLYVTALLLIGVLFLILVFVDRSRPDKKYHIKSIGDEGPAGCLGWFNFIPILLMADSFTDWFNDYLPFIKQPYYDDEWYITVLMWIIWWNSNMAIISLPQYLLEWRLKHFKSDEEAKAEIKEQELTVIRNEIKEEEKRWEENKKKKSYVDDLPF